MTTQKVKKIEEAAAKPADTTEPKPEDGRAVLTKAIKMAERQREREAAEVEAERDRQWAAYVALLQRAGSPKRDDAAELGRLMVALEVTSEQVEADLKLIAKHHMLKRQHADRAGAHEKWAKASAHARELEKRLHEELVAAQREAGLAAHEMRGSTEALFEACRLHLARPELFEGEPVALNQTGNAKFPELLTPQAPGS